MSEEREKVRCRNCELVQWSDRANCRRCGSALPEPVVRIVERVVEKVVIRQDPQCLQKLEQAVRRQNSIRPKLHLLLTVRGTNSELIFGVNGGVSRRLRTGRRSRILKRVQQNTQQFNGRHRWASTISQ